MEKEQNQNTVKNTSEEKENQETISEETTKNSEEENKDKDQLIEESPEEKILKLEDKLARTFAEMENQRRRFEKEKEDAYEYGGFAFAREALNLIDNLERSKQILLNDESLKNSKALSKTLEHFDIINKEDIAKIEPSLAPIYYKGIILKGESFTKSPLQITLKIFDNFINNGGHFVLSKIDSIIKKGDSLFLKYKKQECQFDKIVVAAGVWSNFLAKTIGDNFPLDTERGYHIMFENNKDLINHPIGWAKKNFYITPMEDGIRAAGTVEIAGYKKPMNKNMIKLIEDSARTILPKLGKVKSHWMGFRPTLPDSLPVIGESKKCNNVYYAFGHQHLGLSLAAVTGKVIQSLVENINTNINIQI